MISLALTIKSQQFSIADVCQILNSQINSKLKLYLRNVGSRCELSLVINDQSYKRRRSLQQVFAAKNDYSR